MWKTTHLLLKIITFFCGKDKQKRFKTLCKRTTFPQDNFIWARSFKKCVKTQEKSHRVSHNLITGLLCFSTAFSHFLNIFMEFCQIEQGNNFEKKQIKQKHEKRKLSKNSARNILLKRNIFTKSQK